MIWYLPLEPYPDRYTGQLRDWTETRLRSRGVDFTTVLGTQLGSGGPIASGAVLDGYGRSYWGLTQSARLIERFRAGEVQSGDTIFCHDMFHPGLSGILYTAAVAGIEIKLYVHAWADSVDIYDFTDSMRSWKRHDERMVDARAAGIFVASQVFGDLFRPCEFNAPIHVVGLPFDIDEVRARVPNLNPWVDRPRRVVYSSRLDREKNPHFFLDVVEACPSDIEFVILTGSPLARSNDPTVLERLSRMASRIEIKSGLSKNEYYAEVAKARVQFNCAFQDFVSFTMLEASSLGTPSLVPAFRSFIEEMTDRPQQTYKPWDVTNAKQQLNGLLNAGAAGVAGIALRHNMTLDRVIDVLIGSDKYLYRGPFG